MAPPDSTRCGHVVTVRGCRPVRPPDQLWHPCHGLWGSRRPMRKGLHCRPPTSADSQHGPPDSQHELLGYLCVRVRAGCGQTRARGAGKSLLQSLARLVGSCWKAKLEMRKRALGGRAARSGQHAPRSRAAWRAAARRVRSGRCVRAHVAPTLQGGERGENWGARARERRALTDCSCRALPRCAGPIPESIGNLTSLQTLWLNRNALSGA